MMIAYCSQPLEQPQKTTLSQTALCCAVPFKWNISLLILLSSQLIYNSGRIYMRETEVLFMKFQLSAGHTYIHHPIIAASAYLTIHGHWRHTTTWCTTRLQRCYSYASRPKCSINWQADFCPSKSRPQRASNIGDTDTAQFTFTWRCAR